MFAALRERSRTVSVRSTLPTGLRVVIMPLTCMRALVREGVATTALAGSAGLGFSGRQVHGLPHDGEPSAPHIPWVMIITGSSVRIANRSAPVGRWICLVRLRSGEHESSTARRTVR